MTAVMTPNPVHDTTVVLTRAVAGERMGMDTGTAPLATLLQGILNIAAFAAAAGRGGLEWSGQMTVGGTSVAPVIFVGPIALVVLLHGSTYKAFTGASEGVTLGAGQIEGADFLVPGWYYVYAWNNAGTLAYEISLYPPTASGSEGVLRPWKRSSTGTHRYLGCFRTDGSGNPIPMRRAGGRYSYVLTGTTTELRALNAGVAEAWATVSCAAMVPPHAFLARLLTIIESTGADYQYGRLRTPSTSSSSIALACYASGAGPTCEVELVLDASQQLEYQCSALTGHTGALTAFVLGFEE